MIEVYSVTLPLQNEILEEMNSWLKPEQSNFATKRKESFLAGRYCAKSALKKLGLEVSTIEHDEEGRPCWPAGFCGSISHSKGTAIAVISNTHISVGLDIEKIIEKERLDRIQRIFITTQEVELFSKDPEFNGSLIFSAKEALFKLINPLCHEFFGFSDAHMIEISSENFKIELHSQKNKVAPFNKIYSGKHWMIDNQVVTLLVI